MEENDYDDYGSSDGPTFVDGYAIYFSLGVFPGNAPGSPIFHKETARMPVYMPDISQTSTC